MIRGGRSPWVLIGGSMKRVIFISTASGACLAAAFAAKSGSPVFAAVLAGMAVVCYAALWLGRGERRG